MDGSHRQAPAEPGRAPSREGAPAGQSHPAQAGLDPRAGAQLAGIRRDQAADARVRPHHGVRGGGLPEHRRVLEEEARDLDDHGRHLHAGLRLLQRQDRQAAARSIRTSRSNVAEAVGKLGLDHVVVTSVDRDDLADGGAGQFAEGDRGAARARRPATTIEILTPDFLRKPRRGRDRRRRAARRLQPQSRDRAAALSDDPARRALLRLAAAAVERSRRSTRRCSPSPA